MGTGDAAGQGGVNNPRAVADPASAKGDPIPRPASCLPIGAESNAGRHMRVVSRRGASRGGGERGLALARPPPCPRPQTKSRLENPNPPATFYNGFWSKQQKWRLVASRPVLCSAPFRNCTIVKHIQVSSDPCMLVQESEGDRAEAQPASTFGRCHETNSDNVITIRRYCITAHTRRRTSCQIDRQPEQLVAVWILISYRTE
jgi:hypothetical protein